MTPTNLDTKRICFYFFLSVRRIQRQESNFQQTGGLLKRNISECCLNRVALYLKDIPKLL